MEDMEIELENSISAEIHIPEDIIPDILLRLPVKSLARFRCVSKSWLCLISSHRFAMEQLKHNKSRNDKLIFGSHKKPMDLYTCSIKSIIEGSNSGVDQIYPPTNDNILTDRIGSNNCPFVGVIDGIRIVGSCNGLVCVHLKPDIMLLCNPTTRESKRLPHSGTHFDYPFFCFSFAFGYVELHDDYKVVELLWHERDLEIVIKVYSLRSNSWKILSNWPGGHIFDGMGKFVNGAVHWLVGDYDTPDERVIVSLDLATDIFTEFTLPTLDDDDDVAVEVDILENDDVAVEEGILEDDDAVVEEGILEDDDVAVEENPFGDDDVVVEEENFVGDFVALEVDILEGCLALYCSHNTHMNVWVMKEYGASNSWAKAYKILFLLNIRDHLEFVAAKPRPLFFSVDGKVLINYGESLRIHDLNNPRSHQFSSAFSVETTTYFESLVSPSLDNNVIFGRIMPPKIITEVLLRMPVKSLMRFKSVSKEWLSLISSSSFVKAHLKTSTTMNNVKLIFGPTSVYEGLYTCSISSMIECPDLNGSVYAVGDINLTFDHVLFDSYVVPPRDQNAKISIVGSCNGLVCMTFSRNIILVNPATRKSRIIPESHASDIEWKHYNFSYAFGYDEVHGDYKVVEFSSFENKTNMFNTNVEVYSMRANSWKSLWNWPGGGTCGCLGTCGCVGKCLNGSIHWLVRGLFYGLDKRVIVSHNLATDTFVQLPLPNSPDIDDAKIEDLIILGRCLAFYCIHEKNMDVWVMKEYGVIESWARVVRIPFFMNIGYPRPRPVFLRDDGKILMNYGSSLKIHDTRNPQPHQFERGYKVVAKTYVESLVSPTLDEDVIN